MDANIQMDSWLYTSRNNNYSLVLITFAFIYWFGWEGDTLEYKILVFNYFGELKIDLIRLVRMNCTSSFQSEIMGIQNNELSDVKFTQLQKYIEHKTDC